ncbi:dolichyl-phosphate beta-glucosyltransferase [Pseudofrankia asymbiotica]|uniref:dolichyl-phosphate beta-glucosyltransferase n=1 Tax=Pseudofrankia asymbiotica TaxID=1834516 RepID=UPI001F521ACC|nr:dolichyl-phosphate beta-glucosyltransferase [Pseudofrankia asymbiotica]
MGWDLDRVPVSVVIPAFNEARRLPWSLPVLADVLRRFPGSELIVVDDGSTDDTSRIAGELLRDVPNSRVIRLPWNSGKGAAIRVGVAAAVGEAIVFMDADLASDISDLPLLLAALEHAEVALGSRRLGRTADRAAARRLGSWAFNQLTRSLVSLDLADTQCGFKAFRHAEAKVLFGLSQANGFGFDVEVLSLARSLGYRIAEIPVRWSEEPGGTFRVVRHTPAMLAELARARRHARRSLPGRPVAPSAWPNRGRDAAGPPKPATDPSPAGSPIARAGSPLPAVPTQVPALSQEAGPLRGV